MSGRSDILKVSKS